MNMQQKNHFALIKSSFLAIFLATIILTITACKPIVRNPPSQGNSQPVETATTPVEQQEDIAILTHIDGTATIEAATTSRRTLGLMRLFQATPTAFQLLRDGTQIRVEEGGTVTVVCFNNHIYRVRGPGTVIVSGSSCNSGSQLPTGVATHVTPDNGRVVRCDPNTGVCRLEGEAREKEADYGDIPIILTPRNTSLLDVQPETNIVWVNVPESFEYVFSLSSFNAYPEITLDAEQLECFDDEMAVPGQICTTPWPEEWTFEPGNTYFLEIAVREDIVSPLRASEKSALKMLTVDERETLMDTLSALESLDVDDITKHILRAGVFADHELYGDAIVAYEAALAEQPVAILYVALGDLYRAIDLNRYAFRAYNNALDLLAQGPDDLMIRAAAQFGQGQVEYSRLNFQNAEPHFEAAVELYAEAGGMDGLAASEMALAETRQRLP